MSASTNPALSECVAFCRVVAEDFDDLVALRIAAMRESLEQIGRFDPVRARDRLKHTFYPEHSQLVLLNGQRVGFYTFRPEVDGYRLDHFYIHPAWQSKGIGSLVMLHLLALPDAQKFPIRLNALRGSRSNEFYQRHGFMKTSEDEWDIYYLRPPVES